jgi:hypothetical protein
MRAEACTTAAPAAGAAGPRAEVPVAAEAAAPEVAAGAVAAPAAVDLEAEAAAPEGAVAAGPAAASRRPAAVLVALVRRSTAVSFL